MAKVYIAAHDYLAARYLKSVLEEHGHRVVSTWHDGVPRKRSDADKQRDADRNIKQINGCDTLVLISCMGTVPGGKFVEAGVAIGLGKKVIILGSVENNLLYASAVTTAWTPDKVADAVDCSW